MQRITQFIFKLSVCILPMLSTGIVSAQQDSSAVKTEKQKKGIPVNGIIRDANTGEPLSGINVAVPNFSATISDDDGKFSVNVPSLSTPLLVSGQGVQTKEQSLRGEAYVEISLYEEDYPSFYDKIHMPSGTKLETRVPYATGTIRTDESQWGLPVNETVGTFMEDRVSGLYVTRRSGTPNIGADILIRGYNSLYATNRPLIVVDGMIYDDSDYGSGLIENHYTSPLSNIEIKDIQEITFVKDGSSLYGTKGSNGVIMITTTRPEVLSTKIDFAAYGGFNQKPDALPLMQAGDYRTYISELLTSKGLSQEELAALPFMNDNQDLAGYYNYHNNTNWQDLVFNDKSYNQNYYLKIQGGDNIAKYALSVGYLSNDGIVKNTGLKRYNTRFNADLQLSPKLRMIGNLSFAYAEQDLRNQGWSTTSPISLALTKSPFLSQHEISESGQVSPNYTDADAFNISNPSVLIENGVGLNRNYRFFGNLDFGYDFSNTVNLHSIVGLNYSKVRENFFIPNKGVVNDTLRTAVAKNRSGSEIQRLFSLYNDTYLNYNKSFSGRHSVDLRLGVRLQSNKAESDFGLGYNSPTDDFTSVGAGTNALREVGGFLGDWNWINAYLATNYGYLNRYFISVNLGVDGSSRFGNEAQDWALGMGNEKFSFLPSVAAAWLISSEPFMAGNDFVNFWKLRASYGLSGNGDIGNYTAQKYYVSQNLLGMQGLVRGSIGNPQLQWEIVKKANLGTDISFFNERLSATLDVFKNKTDNMIIYEPVNVASGFDHVVSNSGAMETQGIEGSLNARVLNGGLKFDLGVTVSHYENEVTSLPVDEIITSFGGATFITKEGLPGNLFYGLESNGVYTTNEAAAADGLQKRLPNGDLVAFSGGDMKFSDTNGDQIIDGKDRTIIGDPNPSWVGMVNGKFSYKRFSLDAIFNFSYGNDLYNGTRALLEGMSGYENQSLAVLNRWRANGQDTDMPRATWGDPMGNASFSSRWIEDGSYLRLRTLILSYDLPIFNNTLRYATVYATANNLFTVTDYLGYDPEFSAGGSIYNRGVDIGLEPQYRTFQLGFRLGL